MTFLELQNDIKKSRKLLRKRRKQHEDFIEKSDSDQVLELLYKKALTVANKVVNHYIDLGELDEKEKIAVTFANSPDSSISSSREIQQLQFELKLLRAEIKKLQADNDALKKQLTDFYSKFTRGGRKGYDSSMTEKIKLARDNGESWRTLAKRLGISTATAQKLYKSLKKK